MPVSTQSSRTIADRQATALLIKGSLEMLLSSRQLLAVSEHRRSGLILCKEHHAEFAGPGAAVGSDVEQTYKVIIAIGSPNLVRVTNHTDRQRAYSRRIQWGRWLHKIVDNPDPFQRVERLFYSFEEFFGYQVAANLPNAVLANLVGVLPQTIQTLRQHYRLAEPQALAYAESPRCGEVVSQVQGVAILEEFCCSADLPQLR
jgi:hypothetical protein